ncbi:MAG: M1 family metallopeptidase [Bacteroidia bacterium]|nr:M1 family metallopeptidase [Bacteroidia bacterium]
MRKVFCFYLLFILLPFVSAHDGYPRNFNADVLHYEFALTINDSTDRIEGRALIKIKFINEADSISFDLTGINREGKGMGVTSVHSGPKDVKWEQEEERLLVFFDNPVKQNDTLEFVIEYNGIPADGLIISKNKFGNRTFFADHWPDRAHNYLPCIDHPYDKASVDFIITAPDRYKVIASGTLVEESDLVGNMTLTHWSETVPLAIKVMTFGAAEFAVQLAGNVNNIPVWSWVYPENRKEGFSDYSVAIRPLEYYSRIIGQYPYKKLANVQSKTIYGGLENAGTIFYSENSVSGLGRAEGLIAHEIAHQWFGDCITETDWHHIWLSEGFATYMTSLYFESLQGKDRLESDMTSARAKVLKYYEKHAKPVIDTTITNLMDLLSVNSYQKGAWVLHMLRHDLGDEVFMKGLRLYYERFYNSNALTEDFKNVMEEVSGRNLGKFFQQWLYTAGQPELRIWHENGKKKGMIDVYIEQKQEHLFEFNLELLIKDASGEKIVNVIVKERVTKIMVPSMNNVEIIPDPNVNLLFK